MLRTSNGKKTHDDAYGSEDCHKNKTREEGGVQNDRKCKGEGGAVRIDSINTCPAQRFRQEDMNMPRHIVGQVPSQLLSDCRDSGAERYIGGVRRVACCFTVYTMIETRPDGSQRR